MNRRTKLSIVGAALGSAMVGLALATPPEKIGPALFGLGTDNANIEVHGLAQTGDDEFHVRLHTNGPSNVGVQEVTFAPGGSIGWHSHPGMVIVQLVSGTIEWFDENCNATEYKAGDVWTEGNRPHNFRNNGTVTAQVLATVIVAKGAGLRIDQPEPACAAALGLN